MSVSATAFVGRLFGPDDQRVISTAIYRWNNGVPYISLSLGGDVTLFLDREMMDGIVEALVDAREAVLLAETVACIDCAGKGKVNDCYGEGIVERKCEVCSGLGRRAVSFAV